MGFVRRLLSAVFLLGLIAAVLAAAVGTALVKREASGLPSVSAVGDRRPALTSRIFAQDGSLLGEFAEQNRTAVPLDAVPPLVQQAFVSAEDRSFWRHQGIDPVAIVRATLSNLRNRHSGRRMIGASTITQQVVKNELVGDEQSMRRKLREALLAVHLEREIGKRRVLEIYLNGIYLGQGAYGVAAAADAYFGKPLSDLSLADAALLAAMPKGPANYDPVRRPDAALARRAYVLKRMAEDGAVSPEQAAAAQSEPLPRPSGHPLGGPADGYFAEEVRRQVIGTLGAPTLYRGGLTVRTSMDPQLQALAEKALREGLSEYDRRHGWSGPIGTLPSGTKFSDPASWRPALLDVEQPAGAEDWRTAAVLGFERSGSAVLGMPDGSVARMAADGMRWARRITARGLGPEPRSPRDALRQGDVVLVAETAPGQFGLRQIPQVDGALVAMEVRTGRVLAVAGGFSHERSSFDRAIQSVRQPGSAFKPFVYLTAFQNGWDPTSPVMDSPVSIDVGGGAPRWRPGADGGGGWGLITARRALENSRNLASVRLLYELGLDQVGETARRFGVYDSLPSFAAALGALEVSDLRLTAAYAMIANGGHRLTPTLIDSIVGPDGAVTARRADAPMDESARIADPVAVAQLTSVLEGVVRRGTAAQSLGRIPLPIAGKTGTTNDNVDAWFVGFTPDIAVGVHIGFDRPEPLGPDEFGGRSAAPIFGEFIKGALALHPPSAASFPVPAGAKAVTVDPASGEPSASGLREIVRATPP